MYYYNYQSFLLFESNSGSFDYTKSTGGISNWLSTGLHNENNIDLNGATNLSSILSQLFNSGNRLNAVFTGNYFKQNKISSFHSAVVNIYIVYELQERAVISPDFTVQNAFFGVVKITKDVNTSHYKYSGYGISFDYGF